MICRSLFAIIATVIWFLQYSYSFVRVFFASSCASVLGCCLRFRLLLSFPSFFLACVSLASAHFAYLLPTWQLAKALPQFVYTFFRRYFSFFASFFFFYFWLRFSTLLRAAFSQFFQLICPDTNSDADADVDADADSECPSTKSALTSVRFGYLCCHLAN